MLVFLDGIIEEKEWNLFEFFLLFVNFDFDEYEVVKMCFNQGILLEELMEGFVDLWLLWCYLFDIFVLMIFFNYDVMDQEKEFLKKLVDWLGFK